MRHQLTTTIAAITCASAALSAGAASAGQTVDPSTLVPMPPPGSTCQATGVGVTCYTTFDASIQNEPAFPLSCGLVYESASDVRRGLRWYVDGRLDRRLVFQNATGSWSLSPSGTTPSVTWTAHASWENRDIDADAPEETWPTTVRGMSFRLSGPDGRPIFEYAGLENPDGAHHGLGDWTRFESPDVDSTICAVLTGSSASTNSG